MVQLQKELASVTAVNVQVVAVSYDSVEKLHDFATENKINFPLLSDADSKVIEAFGVRNPKAKPGSKKDGIPHPGTFLIDQEGVVRAKLFYNILRRHTPAELVTAAKQLSADPVAP